MAKYTLIRSENSDPSKSRFYFRVETFWDSLWGFKGHVEAYEGRGNSIWFVYPGTRSIMLDAFGGDLIYMLNQTWYEEKLKNHDMEKSLSSGLCKSCGDPCI